MDNDQVLLELLARLTEAAEGINAESALLVTALERIATAMEMHNALLNHQKSFE